MSRQYSEILHARQKYLQKHATHWERLFKKRLRALGIVFEFQALIPPYFPDFLIRDRNLIIELDGQQHYTPEGIARDCIRTRYLEEQGFTVLRIPNPEAMTWPLERIFTVPQIKPLNRKQRRRKNQESRRHGKLQRLIADQRIDMKRDRMR